MQDLFNIFTLHKAHKKRADAAVCPFEYLFTVQVPQYIPRH